MHGQLPLKFPLRKEFTLDRFRVGLNQELIETDAGAAPNDPPQKLSF